MQKIYGISPLNRYDILSNRFKSYIDSLSVIKNSLNAASSVPLSIKLDANQSPAKNIYRTILNALSITIYATINSSKVLKKIDIVISRPSSLVPSVIMKYTTSMPIPITCIKRYISCKGPLSSNAPIIASLYIVNFSYTPLNEYKFSYMYMYIFANINSIQHLLILIRQ